MKGYFMNYIFCVISQDDITFIQMSKYANYAELIFISLYRVAAGS